jgi:hypothetical protein
MTVYDTNNANYKIHYDYNLINFFMNCFNFQYNEGKFNW